MGRNFDTLDLIQILDSNVECDQREALVRALIESTGVTANSEIREELNLFHDEIVDGVGHWSDLALIFNSIPRARGEAGPGFVYNKD